MPPANRAGDQFDTLVVVRHKPVLEDSLKPSRLCRVSGRNGGQSIPQLNEVFGEHTYFVNSDGLIILEPTGSGLTGVQSAKVVNLGEWSDDAPSALELHEPETTDLVVTLGFRH